MKRYTKEELSKILNEHKTCLSYANLSGADFSGADLSYANLIGADLSYANLSGADLSGADLSDVSLWSCNGNGEEVKSFQIFGEYTIEYTYYQMQIGCQRHGIEEWRAFDDDTIDSMEYNKALDFWKKNKTLIFRIVDSSPAVDTKRKES